jgi:anti-sigma B factor antagonist
VRRSFSEGAWERVRVRVYKNLKILNHKSKISVDSLSLSFVKFVGKGVTMPALYTQREVGGVVLVDVKGRITLGEGTSGLRDQIRELANNGKKKVVLNLCDTWYVDSSGVGELISSFETLKAQGAVLKLLALTKRVKDTLLITKMYTVFECHDDEAAAVRSFEGN